jgi:transposase
MNKSMDFNYFIGIDVSKKTLDISVFKGKEFDFHSQIENSIKSFKTFLSTLKKKKIDVSKCLFCAENTGVYNEHLKTVCEQNELFLWVEKPLQIIKSQGITRGKTDKIDSKRIAYYAYKNQEDANKWIGPRPVIVSIKRLISLRKNLLNNLKQLKQVINEKTFLNADLELMTNAC